MRSTTSSSNTRLIMGIALIALLAACGKAEPPAPPAPVAPPQAAVAPEPAPAPQVVATESAPQPAAQLPAKVAVSEPALSTMQVATVSSKMSVPADLRFQFDGDALSGQPVTLHLAAVPRIAGSNLKVSIKQVPGIEAVEEVFTEQKVNAAATYRKQLSVRRLADGPTELRVVVTMDMPIGTAFAYYSVPFAAATPASKQPAERRQQ